MLLNTITKKIRLNIPLLLIGLFALPSIATAADTSTSIKSISYASDAALDTTTKTALLKQAESIVIAPVPKPGFRSESASVEKLTLTTSYMHSGDFSIYNLDTDLISDFDYDGFYHRFSITIDADTLYSSAYVYAKIYLSYEGGPWSYMASSNAYPIYSDSATDAFTIETELSDGFYAGYYDVRIELYDADSNDWLLSYGPYDDSSISALPLEDSYNDDFYDAYDADYSHAATTDVYVAGHGSMGGGLLIALGLMFVARKLSSKTLH